MAPILEVENLSVAFGTATVLTNLSFTLSKGESLGIVGESGSGKSITALSLMGLLPNTAKVTSGKAKFLNNQISYNNFLGLPDSKHRSLRGKLLAMIFQEPMTSLNPSMRCGKQVEEAIKLHSSVSSEDAFYKCLSLFSEMQLPNPLKVYRSFPHELSGGQKQRVMIAMALAGDPSILIADEPTTALDVTVQKEIIRLLNDIVKKRGMSLIFISHDLGVVSEVTQRVLVLKNGIMVEQGATNQILLNPKQPYTQGLVACRPPLNSRPAVLPTVQDFLLGNVDKTNSEEINTSLLDCLYEQEPILTVSNLSVDYVIKRNLLGKPKVSFHAVKNLSVNLYPSETLGLVGESGCGKTTLGRTILGLTTPKEGTICYKGKNILSLSARELKDYRREVQLVFQDPYSSLNPRFTVGETLMEPIAFHGLASSRAKAKEQALHLLTQVALPHDSFYRYPHEFSGGQRQRVAIARALAVKPRVIVCDEMVSALDVSVQAQILNLLNELKRSLGLTYIFISHDLSVVKYMSNRMLVMREGQTDEYGNSNQVCTFPQSPYTQQLIDAIPGKNIIL